MKKLSGFAKMFVFFFAVVLFFVQAVPVSGWTLEEKIKEAEKKLSKTKLRFSSKLAEYHEDRIFFGETVRHTIVYYSFAEIALATLDVSTGKIEIIKITRRGPELVNKNFGYEIEIEKRFSGMAWNGYNTPFLVKKPENRVVISNLYVAYRKGKAPQFVIYSPYSSKIHSDELAKKGEKYLDLKIEEAYSELKKLKVKSTVFPDKLAADAVSKEMVKAIILIEQIDPDEFLNVDKKKIAERVYVILGLNGKNAYAMTTSNKGAQGLAQFMKKTYHSIRGKYPRARLNKNFVYGTADHKNIIKAAILLLDHNLKDIKVKFGDEILKDPALEEYLAASYNTSISRVKEFIADKDENHYLHQTRIYVKKFKHYKNNK